MAKSKKRKNNKVKKKTNNSRNNKVTKELKNTKPVGPFMAFMSKKCARITLHIITAVVWILFLGDFATFKALDRVPNPILSLLALITLAIEYSIHKGKNNK